MHFKKLLRLLLRQFTQEKYTKKCWVYYTLYANLKFKIILNKNVNYLVNIIRTYHHSKLYYEWKEFNKNNHTIEKGAEKISKYPITSLKDVPEKFRAFILFCFFFT